MNSARVWNEKNGIDDGFYILVDSSANETAEAFLN